MQPRDKKSKKPRKPKKPLRLRKQKNLVIGMLGAARTRGGPNLDIHSKQQKLSKDFQRLLLEARKNVPSDKYDEYLSWLDQQLHAHLPSNRPVTKQYGTFSGLFDSTEMPIEHELVWVASRLANSADALNAFSNCYLDVQGEMLRGNFVACRDRLERFNQERGVSLWLVELHLAIEQLSGGLEAQKAFAQLIKTAATGTLLPFFVHWVSIRNESTVSATGYRERLERTLANPKLDDEIRDYFRFHLLRELPAEKRTLARVLKLEQSQSIFDLFETFVAVASLLVAEPLSNATARALRTALGKLTALKDARLDRIRAVLGEQVRLACRIEFLELILEGDAARGAQEARAALERGEHPIAALLVAAAGGGPSNLDSNAPTSFDAKYVIWCLRCVLDRSQGHAKVAQDLSRFAINVSALGFGAALLMVCRAFESTDPFESGKHLQAAQLCSPASYLDVLLIPAFREANVRRKYDSDSGINTVSALVGAVLDNESHETSLDATASRIAVILHTFRKGEFETCLQAASNVLNLCPARAICVQVGRLALECELRLGHLASALKRMATMLSEDSSMWRYVPVVRALGELRWESLERYSSDISLAIALDAKWRQTHDDKDATLRRFASEEFLSRNGISIPTELENRVQEFGKDLTVQFLRSVCGSTVIDMLEALPSSEAVEQERRAICTLLAKLDPANAEDYRAEIFDISSLLRIREGLKFVDSSRVYVDTDAIGEWGLIHLRESFDRYAALVQAGVGVADDFEVVIKAITRSGETPESILEVPKNEADDILVNMVHELREKFLFDPSHGLNSYLSRRVRHGTIVGYLRSPVEVQKLITQRDTQHSGYQPNEHWARRLTSLSDDQQREVIRSFRRFSEDFDKCLINLRDEKFHVKSQEHPEGLFEIALPPAKFHLIRSFLKGNILLGNLISVCHALFWGALDGSLLAARELLRNKTNNQVADIFARLQGNLLSFAGDDAAFPALSTAIGTARKTVHAETDRIADWFKKPETEAMKNEFLLDHAIGIAIESAKAAHKTLAPAVEIAVPEGVTIAGSGVLTITEVVFTALDNAYQHSRLQHAPSIVIRASCDLEREVVVLRISSEIAKGVACSEATAKLEAIRREIEEGTYDLTIPREGGSGLIKMTAAVASSERGRVEFGFESSSVFFVDAHVPIVFAGRPRDEDSVGRG